MNSLIRIKDSARRSLGAIPPRERQRIVARIHRLRVSGYRIVWEQSEDHILIQRVVELSLNRQGLRVTVS